jgi:hypothetical protein
LQAGPSYDTAGDTTLLSRVGTPSDLGGGATVAANLATVAGYLDTEILAIKAKTDNLPSDPADQSAVEAAILALLTTQMTESYSADGAAPTMAQALTSSAPWIALVADIMVSSFLLPGSPRQRVRPSLGILRRPRPGTSAGGLGF